ncbi:MAG: DUF3307 domain-containing protein, partial [Flavobacteriaceae bacterium]|nr:DUF3307 domain-containing protein [Flavobacteriaceae bacterium]
MNTLLILQLTAHLLADFNFQPQGWCDIKDRKMISKTHLYHIFIVFACSWLLSLTISFWWAALLITLFHLAIDVAKSYLSRKESWRNHLFFIDQALHIALITGVVYLFSAYTPVHFPSFISINRAFILFAVIACSKPSNIFIKKYMEANAIFPASENKTNKAMMKAGRVIGSLERVISFCLIAVNQFAAVGFIIAAKSILRFRDT